MIKRSKREREREGDVTKKVKRIKNFKLPGCQSKAVPFLREKQGGEEREREKGKEKKIV